MTTIWRPGVGFVLGAALCCLSSASAQTLQDGPPPEHRIVYRSFTGVRLNATQLLTDMKATYRHRLFRSDSANFADNFLGIGLGLTLTPAGFCEAIHLEFAPASFVQFFFTAELWQWLGNFNFFQSWAHAEENWGPKEVARLGTYPKGDARRNYATTGYAFTGTMVLQKKFGPIALRNSTRLAWSAYALREGDLIYYDPLTDLAAPNRGFTMNNDTEANYVLGRLALGVRLALGQALFRPTDFSAGATNPNVMLARLGPVASWRFFQEHHLRFNPALSVQVSWFLSHRFRTGADVSQAFPQMGLAFTFWGDVLAIPVPAER